MATEHSGGGDPKRVMELLWGTGERRKRGPKPRLTVEEITRTAVEMADAEGLAALSMRRLAEQLGITAMSGFRFLTIDRSPLWRE